MLTCLYGFWGANWKDLLSFIELFKSDDAAGHPALVVMDLLAGKIEDNNKLHAQQLETWFRDYATWRENPSIFKDVVVSWLGFSTSNFP